MIEVSIPTEPTSGTATETRRFYSELFGIDLRAEPGWVVTLEAGCAPMAQETLCDEAHLTVEVEDVDTVHRAARRLGADIFHGLRDRDSGQRRLILRDPSGRWVNIVAHDGAMRCAA